jgi:hypothetical protein
MIEHGGKMKNFFIRIIFALSILFNLITIFTILYGYSTFFKLRHSDAGTNMAIVTDVINVDINGYKNSQIVALYDGNRIVIDNPGFIMSSKYVTPRIGSIIKIKISETSFGYVKMIRFSLDQ